MMQTFKHFSYLSRLLVISILAGCDLNSDIDNNVKNNETAQQANKPVELSSWLAGTAQEGFERAIEPRQFIFPQDHWSHDTFQIEWWYITGNVSATVTKASKETNSDSDEEKEFGYQVTFFRIGLSPTLPPALPPKSLSKSNQRSSAWASKNMWMAHVALTDNSAAKHYYDERLSRGAAGLAGIQKNPFKVWLEDWQIVGVNNGKNNGEFPWKVSIKNKDFALYLKLSPTKPIVLQGKNGLSQKSGKPGNASYYYSFSRLKTEGKIISRTPQSNHQYNVTGWSWLDREWSTSALGNDQAGWNWFSLQLNDGTDLMYYQMQRKDGKIDSHSSGNWINKNGTYVYLKSHKVQLAPLKYWQSETGKKYVTEWKMKIPSKNVEWIIKAMLDDQEMLTTVRYWEGAVRIFDAKSGKAIGKGYLEMTGY